MHSFKWQHYVYMPLLKTKRRSPARKTARHCAKARMRTQQTFVGISESVFTCTREL